MDTQNNSYGTNTNSSIVGVNHFNQAVALPKQIDQNYNDSNSLETDNSLDSLILADSDEHKSNDNDLDLNESDKSDNYLSNLSLIGSSNSSDVIAEDTIAEKDYEPKDPEDSQHNGKKGKKAKSVVSNKSDTNKSEPSELDRTVISFSISAKEKKQIEAVAILSGYEKVEEFVAKLVCQGVKPYLEAVSQALNKA